MDEVCGLFITVDSSEGIPKGCYSVSISYATQKVHLGHMKKNCKAGLGHFFLIDNTNVLALKVAPIELHISRKEHSFTKEFPFGSIVIPSEDILSDRLHDVTKLTVQITHTQYTTVTCSLSIRIQRIYSNTLFTEPPGENAVLHPCLLQLCIDRSEISQEEWNSQFYCRLELPNGDCSITSLKSGRTPSWGHIVYLSNPEHKNCVNCTVKIFRQGSMFDSLVGSGLLQLDLIPTSVIETEKQCDIIRNKSQIACVYVKLKYISSYATCSRMNTTPTRTLPSFSICSANARSVSSDHSKQSGTDARSVTKGKQFRFVKVQDSFQ